MKKEGMIVMEVLANVIGDRSFLKAYMSALKLAYKVSFAQDSYRRSARSAENAVLSTYGVSEMRERLVGKLQRLNGLCGNRLFCPIDWDDDVQVDTLIDDVWDSGIECVRLGLIAA